MASLQTKPTTPRLTEVARHVVAPAGVVSTGWPMVRDKCRDLNITFRWWQHPVGRNILSKRADGKYAATIGGTGLSIPRQVGKTFLVGAIVFALCLLNPGLTVIWTAHRVRTAEETFGKMQKFAKRAKIAPLIERVVLGSGEEAILFTNGSRILFGAREGGFGLGFDEVDVLIFDEAQRLKEQTLDDMVPATNQSRQPSGALLLFMGTPPRPTDAGEVFTRMRSEALAGEDTDTGWIEFGCDPGYVPAEKPAPLTEADWRQVAKANPSFPDDTPREAILRMRKQLSPESFIREGLGEWDEDDSGRVFGSGKWLGCRGVKPPGLQIGALGVEIEADLSSAAIVAAASSGDRVAVRPLQHGPGDDWIVGRLKALQASSGALVVLDGTGPAVELVPRLKKARIRHEILPSKAARDAFDALFRLVTDGKLLHEGYPELDAAVKGAVAVVSGDRRKWGRWKSTSDISALGAATVAAYWVSKPKRPVLPPVQERVRSDLSLDSSDLASVGF